MVFATQHISFLLDLFLDKSCRGLDAAALVANKVVPELSAKWKMVEFSAESIRNRLVRGVNSATEISICLAEVEG